MVPRSTSSFFAISVVFLLVQLVSADAGLLDIEELKSMSYEVDIAGTPIKLTQDPSPQVLYMTSKFGQRYQCKLPDVVSPQQPDKTSGSGDEENAAPDVLQLLEPMRKAPCLVKTKDWWTYDFCYGNFVRQYHVSDGVIEGPISILGIYDRDQSWSNASSVNVVIPSSSKSRRGSSRYHSQYYVNGTTCDLTGQPRRAEIRFYCEEDAGDYIYRVDEPETCAYVVTVHTSRLCGHPHFQPASEKSPHTISCSPMLAEEQYEEYLQVLAEEKRVAEEKRKAWIQKQQERVRGIRRILDRPAAEGEEEEASTAESEPTKMQGEGEEGVSVQEEEDEITQQFGTILEEAEEELQAEDDARSTAFDKLAATLNRLLDKLDKAEKHVAIATEELERAKHAMAGKADREKSSPPKATKDEDATVEVDEQGEDTTEDAAKTTEEDEDLQGEKVRVRLRKAEDVGGRLQQYELDAAQKQRLEKVVKERLEQAGLETSGRRIEVKIITTGYYDEDDDEAKDVHVLSEEETQQFQNMIFTLLTGNQEAVQEMERQRRLEKNYAFTWQERRKSDSKEED